MRMFVGVVAVMAAGCAAQPAPHITEARHAANVAAAQRSGYKVVRMSDRSLFCPGTSETGSRVLLCLTETEFQSLLGKPQ